MLFLQPTDAVLSSEETMKRLKIKNPQKKKKERKEIERKCVTEDKSL